MVLSCKVRHIPRKMNYAQMPLQSLIVIYRLSLGWKTLIGLLPWVSEWNKYFFCCTKNEINFNREVIWFLVYTNDTQYFLFYCHFFYSLSSSSHPPFFIADLNHLLAITVIYMFFLYVSFFLHHSVYLYWTNCPHISWKINVQIWHEINSDIQIFISIYYKKRFQINPLNNKIHAFIKQVTNQQEDSQLKSSFYLFPHFLMWTFAAGRGSLYLVLYLIEFLVTAHQ